MVQLTVFSTFVALLCTGFEHVGAGAIVARQAKLDLVKKSAIVQREVVNPPITYPTTGTAWAVGERHNVTWDTSVIPKDFKSNGMIVLGFLTDADGDNEHLDLAHPLAKGFPITDGRAEITVPSVTTRDTYILILFGDSGNASGKFTIKNIIIGGPSSSSSAAPSSTTSGSSASSSTEDDHGGAKSSSKGSDDTLSAGVKSSSGSGSESGSGSAATTTGAASTSGESPTTPTASGATPTSPAAQSGTSSTSTPSTSTNAGARTVPFSGPVVWVPIACAVPALLGWAL